MSKEASDSESENLPNIEVPLYCYHSKYFLVEELALQEVYHKLHYGRCCIIGKVATDPTDPCKSFIENIRLPSLPKKYSLPEGTIRLPIIIKDFPHSIPDGKICEIVGESILYDNIDKTANTVPLTSKDVTEKLNYLRSRNQCELEYKSFLLSRYKPTIAVDHIQVLERGHELAERNLEIRMLLMK